MIEELTIKEMIRSAECCSLPLDNIDNSKILSILEQSNSGIIFIIFEERLYGIITAGDIRRTLGSSSGEFKSFLINREPICVQSQESAKSCLYIMLKNEVTILPVVDENKLMGYITLQDLSKVFSPERVYLTDSKNCEDLNKLKHIYRYRFASMFMESGRVLDCACGSGYGSKILSEKSDQVVGVDISKEAIEFAKAYNSDIKIEYRCSGLQDLDFKEGIFQSIVCLETLEHIEKKDMIDYLKKAAGWLAPQGCFIGSSPMLRYLNDKPYVTNPYHINELPKEELIQIIKSVFVDFNILYFHQNTKSFVPLDKESTGFCVFVARKN